MSPTVIATIATPGGLPLGLDVNATTNKVYAAVRDEGGQGRLIVINGATNAVLYDPPPLLGRNPSSVAVNETTNKAYVVNNVSLAPTDPAVSVVNGADDSISHISDASMPGSNPIDVAVNESTNRFYVTHNNSVAVFNGATNALVTDLYLGDFRVAYGVATNSATNLFYVVTYKTNVGEQGVGSIFVINGDTNAVVTTIPVGSYPNQVAVDRGSNKIYVSNSDPGTVSVIDGVANEVITTVTVGSNSYDLALNETTHYVYVANSGGSSVSVIKGSDDTVAATLPMGNFAQVIAVNPTTDRAYAGVGTGTGTVKVIGNFVDTTPPSITDVSDSNDPFSPNGDGVNETTLLRWRLSEDAWVQLHILDGEGNVLRLLVDQQESAGILQGVTWDGKIGTHPDLTVAPDGTYTYRITATDAAENVAEVSGTSTISTKPDLVYTTFQGPASVVAGGTASYTWTIKNSGAADADLPWTDQVWLSTSPTSITGANGAGGIVAPSSLAPGASYDRSFSATVPNVAPGQYYWILETDSNHQVAESNELNNLSSVSVTYPVTVTAADRIAYVYSSDLAASDAFTTLLTARGFAVDPVTVVAAATHDFAPYRAIVIGHETGDLSSWGTPEAVANIVGSGKRVVGVGEGGYAYFGRQFAGALGTIGWPNGWHSSGGTSVRVVDQTDPVWAVPNALSVTTGGTVALYSANSSFVAISAPATVTAVTRIGRETDDDTHYPLIAQGGCSFLWGFDGSPSTMTATGKDLFHNALYGPACEEPPVVGGVVMGVAQCGETILPFARVQLRSGQRVLLETTADEDGAFAFFGVEDGTYELVYIGADGTTTCGAGTTITGDITDTVELPECEPGAPTWTTAAAIGEGTTTGAICRQGASAWYKVHLPPEAVARLRLTGPEGAPLSPDLNLFLYRDIAAEAAKTVESKSDWTAQFAGSEFIGSEFIGGEFIGSEFIGGEFIGGEFIGGEFIGSEFIGGEFIGSEFIGGEFIGSEFIGGEFIGSEFIGGEFIGGEFIGGEFIGFDQFGETLGLGGLDPLAFSSAVPNSLIRVSINKGSQPESIAHYTWERGGDYYIQVRGRNGAFSLGDPFELGVEVTESACSAIDTELGASSLEPPGGAVQTLILTNTARFPEAERQTLTTALASLATATGGYVADLAGDEALGAAYAQWDAHPACSLAANEVADGIKDHLDGFRGAHPEMARIVFAGSDKVLPFRRVEDPAKLAPEWWHVPPVKGTTNTGLRTNKILTDDYYTADHPIVKGNYTIFVPSLATGRLVETADEISNMVDAYIEANGAVTPQTGVVTGYSFLDDLAEDLEAQLQASGVNVTSLIQNEPGLPTAPDAWTAADLSDAIVADPDLLWLNVHHTTPGTFLAADYSKFTSNDLLALRQSHPGLLRGSVVFMTACHSVFNVPDADNIGDSATGEVTRRPDSAQAFARLGATAIGGTGYQYGETIRGVKAYSERLHLLLLRVLREGSGPVELGAALAEAKRRYVGEITEMEDVHAKVTMVATLYGVPGLTIDLGGPQLDAPSDLADFDYADLEPVDRYPGLDPALDLRTIDVDIHETPGRRDVTLDVLDGGGTTTATYFSGSDGTIANPGEPILPRITLPLRLEGTDTFVRGAVFLGGTFTTVDDATPITATPAYQLGEAVPYFFSADAFPAVIQRINYVGGDNLIVTPAQYRSATSASGALETFGTWRRYTDTSFRLYYSPVLEATVTTTQGTFQAALAAPPTLISQTSRADGDTLEFEVVVSAEPHVGVQDVWVTWTADGLGEFSSVALSQDPNEGMRWTGALTLPDGVAPESVRYMLQTVSGVGVASRWTNLGSLYSPEAAAAEVAPKVATSIELGTVPTDLVALRSRSVTARLVDPDGAGLAGKPLTFALGAERLTRFTDDDGYATARFEVTARPGTQPLEVSFAEDATHLGSSVTEQVTIAKETTALALTVLPAVQQLGGSIDVEATLTDGLGRRLREQTVFFQVRDAAGVVRQVAAEEADFNGVARASIPLHVGAGIWTLTAAFAGTVELVGTTTDLTHPRYDGSLSAPFYVVVYDPNGGSVTAGGWIVADPATRRGFADDKLHFGLTWRYGKDTTTPQGSLKLGYKEDDPKLHTKFHSKTADWLVVSGNVAEIEGTGSLNGVDGYRWRARITDEPDGFSIRIWDASSSYASPRYRAERTPVDHGSTQIH